LWGRGRRLGEEEEDTCPKPEPFRSKREKGKSMDRTLTKKEWKKKERKARLEKKSLVKKWGNLEFTLFEAEYTKKKPRTKNHHTKSPKKVDQINLQRDSQLYSVNGVEKQKKVRCSG